MNPSCAAESLYPADKPVGSAALSGAGLGSPAGSAENACDLILGAVSAVRFELTRDEVGPTSARTLAIGERFRLAVPFPQHNLSKLSGCPA